MGVPWAKRPIAFDRIVTQSAVTSTGIGSEVNLGQGVTQHSLEVVTSDTGWSVALQGSLSGGSSSWNTLITAAASSAGVSGGITISTGSIVVTKIRTSLVSKSSDNPVTAYVGVVR